MSKYWDEIALQYDTLYTDQYSRYENEYISEKLLLTVKNKYPRVLELGCGTGLGFRLLGPKSNMNYWGIDTSTNMLTVAKRRFPGATFHNLDMLKLDQLNQKFNLIFAINGVGSYNKEHELLLEKCYGSVLPGGKVLLGFLNRFSFRRIIKLQFSKEEKLHTRNWAPSKSCEKQYLTTKKTLRQMAKNVGFLNIDVTAYGFFGGVWQSPFAAKLEPHFSHLSSIFGHALIIVAEKRGDLSFKA